MWDIAKTAMNWMDKRGYVLVHLVPTRTFTFGSYNVFPLLHPQTRRNVSKYYGNHEAPNASNCRVAGLCPNQLKPIPCQEPSECMGYNIRWNASLNMSAIVGFYLQFLQEIPVGGYSRHQQVDELMSEPTRMILSPP